MTHAAASPQAPAGATPVQIIEGECWVYFAFDVGMAIDLEAVAASPLPGCPRGEITSQRRNPEYLQFRPPPLRVREPAPPIAVAGWNTLPEVDCTLFDFGAASVAYRIPIAGTLESLLPLGWALHENASLLADARARVTALIDRLGPAVRRATLAPVVEDHVVYHARRWLAPEPIDQALAAQRRTLALLLRADAPGVQLSRGEVDDAALCRIAYSDRDQTIIDWNAAVIFEEGAEDTLAVLEYANVELVELRFLDDRLDGVLDSAYQGLHRPGRLNLLQGATRDQRRRLAALQMDSALLFEGINNAIKLVGDQYLARLYRLAAQRFHLQEWDASILRKLQTVESLYAKMVDDAAARRMEILEWIIIVLIAVSIVIPFITP